MPEVQFRIESTQQWVGLLDRNAADEDAIRLTGTPKGDIEIEYDSIPGNSWNQNRLNKFVERANQLLETRTPLTDPSLVDDENGPNGIDPALPYFYWDSGDLVSKTLEIRNAVYDQNHGLYFECHWIK